MARKSRKILENAAAENTPTVYYNAAAYVRLSADAKRKPGDSLETQRSIIERFIADSPDIRLFGVYEDSNATGTNFERPGFRRMLADIESGRVDCVVVKDLSRFGRNAIDAGYYIEKHLPSLNCRFIAVTDGFDSKNGDSGIMLPLKNMIAESYALDISRKCKSVQQQHIKEGRFVGRVAPYGFALSPGDCHRLIIDEEAAAVVRWMFERAVGGMGVGEITRSLNEAKILPPSRYKQSKGLIAEDKFAGSDNWHPRVVAEMLSSRMYAGDMVQDKTQNADYKGKAVSPDKWAVTPNAHEPAVSQELFDAVQKIRRQTKESSAEKQRNGAYSPHLFKGKVFCAKCGYPMHRHRQNKDGTYWFRCESKWKLAKDACGVVSVKEADLKAAIVAVIQKHAEAILGRFIRLGREANCGDKSAAAELREISSKLDKDGRMLGSLYESMVGGAISRSEFVQMKADYEAKIAVLSRRADEIRGSRREAERRNKEYADFGEAVSAVLSSDSLTGEIIEKLVEKVLVNPDKSVEMHFKFADAFGGELRA
jgi:DNA invertase Pin-like site-specific DNA recombinase